ncbi:tRNA (adenosine(37)-N6)-threonylcarbamoyltransferase complex dimerization subunit type 1 TsaB [Anaerobacillus alkaliphilus]|uniref:tRNA (Adenosine(37)-N6)-threonylcarbamoyltransferase complex dimerization subunit type 1 TsaB n=1 Tax=Anaerobacillus alkaliphilus TaxID=1548597 RepID=A0A4Q0VSR2_9BACI|nr:tRNA (adenosine(37)-N6)-threonylcarbamoyltransferase complex dimerization subunit type 1 TsaB [Anaerobacillus alkaliphilus]RXJ01327.1 tRNA (adenosine(37)-N6)-threonylcarbamoyltransferase complex dimerization subunit type 1 TsaB [Anaerobacillus alkaliphilus]
MKVLAIDTSTFVMGVALLDEDKVLGEVITNLKENHSIRLMPAVEKLMKDAGVHPKELHKIVVAHGPGSYTGVRIGVTTAKTLAWTLGIPLIGISSLEALAQNGRYFHGVISPIFDARRGQVYTGLYGNKNGQIQNLREDQILLLEDWLTQLNNDFENILFLGNDVSLHRQLIIEKLGGKATFGLVSDHNPRPAELARLALNMESKEDIHTFTPNYIRLAEAETNWLASQKTKAEQG